MFKLIKFSIVFLLLFNVFSVSVLMARAEETTIIGKAECSNYKCNTGDTSEQGKVCCGNYSLNDMTGVAVKISTFILGIVGSLALLAFVVGGLMMMLSAGNPEWVARGKQTIIGAAVGLVIVFTSYMIIQLVYSALGVPGAGQGGWSISSWFKSENNTSNTNTTKQAFEKCLDEKINNANNEKKICLESCETNNNDCIESCNTNYALSMSEPVSEKCNSIYKQFNND